MKPVAIFRHVAHEGPGYLADVLDRRQIPWQLIAIDRGDPVPASSQDYAGLVFMGGPMSVNDDLPWVVDELALIHAAVAAGIPVLGHCLGGQLIAKALGGQVGRNPVKEIGWGLARRTAAPEAADWLVGMNEFMAFHWHGETFSLPEGATRILESDHCANQAFVLDGRHLAMQCHVEMTAASIAEWCEAGADEIAASDSPAVQTADLMQAQTGRYLPGLHAAADSLYARWLENLVN